MNHDERSQRHDGRNDWHDVGMGLVWLLAVVVLVLGAAALVKYVFFAGRR